MILLKLILIGNATGIVLPDEVLARLGVGQGDDLYLTETPEGYFLSPKNPDPVASDATR